MNKIKVDVELRDYHFLRVTPGEYSLDFELIENINGNEERVRIKGFLKWDGCMNWNTSLIYHFCEEDDAAILNEAFLKLWEIGPEHISKWMD